VQDFEANGSRFFVLIQNSIKTFKGCNPPYLSCLPIVKMTIKTFKE